VTDAGQLSRIKSSCRQTKVCVLQKRRCPLRGARSNTTCIGVGPGFEGSLVQLSSEISKSIRPHICKGRFLWFCTDEQAVGSLWLIVRSSPPAASSLSTRSLGLGEMLFQRVAPLVLLGTGNDKRKSIRPHIYKGLLRHLLPRLFKKRMQCRHFTLKWAIRLVARVKNSLFLIRELVR
jgi:hypothetical protein